MQYLVATSLTEALDALSRPDAVVVAGGTDWFPTHGMRPPKGDMVDITRVPGLRGITRDAGGWRIGGATTWTEVIRADLPSAFDGLKAAAREVGSIQIQNVGTLAGNLCNASPAADGVPPLLTLGAVVELVSAQGTRRIALSDFLKGPRQTARMPGELLSALWIPDPGAHAQGAFLKLGARHYLVISIVMVAALIEVDSGLIRRAVVAVGSCSATAQRLPALEAALNGQSVASVLEAGPALIAPEHLAPLAPIDDVRGSSAYRTEAAATLCARALARALGEADHG